jgi:hypothetical protein
MNTPHERLTRTTFSLPLGEVHALVGGAVNARPLLFLHGFPITRRPPSRSSLHLCEPKCVVDLRRGSYTGRG